MNGFFFIYFKFVKPAFLLLGLILPVMVCFCLVNKSLFDLLGIIAWPRDMPTFQEEDEDMEDPINYFIRGD